MIENLRMGAIKACLQIVRWLSRPHIRGTKILQHYEIVIEAELEPVPANPRLTKVRRGLLVIGLVPVLQVGRNKLDDEIDALEQQAQNGQKEST
jgi:hypothetical protein